MNRKFGRQVVGWEEIWTHFGTSVRARSRVVSCCALRSLPRLTPGPRPSSFSPTPPTHTAPLQLHKDTIIHAWKPRKNIISQVTAHGYRVIWNLAGHWYLDALHSTWERMYTEEPCSDIPKNQCDTLVLGGGGEMWCVVHRAR